VEKGGASMMRGRGNYCKQERGKSQVLAGKRGNWRGSYKTEGGR